MAVVMPPLLQSAQLKPDVTITSADSDNEIDESDDERFDSFIYLLVLYRTIVFHFLHGYSLGSKDVKV